MARPAHSVILSKLFYGGQHEQSVTAAAAILGRIKAVDAESAVREWIEKFDITDPEQQSRLVARPV